jgi:SGNH domain (fused to AT3 domains)
MGWNVPVRLAKIQMRTGHLESSDASTSHKVFRERNLDANRVLDDIQHHNLHRIRPEKVFCDSFVKDRCAAHLNGMPFYFDDDHLSEFGADRIVGQIFDKSKCILHQCF